MRSDGSLRTAAESPMWAGAARGGSAPAGERIRRLALSDAAQQGGGDITRFPSDSQSTLLTFLSFPRCGRKMAATKTNVREQGRHTAGR